MPETSELDLDHARLVVSPGALLTLQRTVKLLPVGTYEQRRAWLYAQGLVKTLFGRPVCRWADVLRALDTDPPRAKERRLPTAPVPRVKL